MAAANSPLRVFHVTGCLDVGGQEKLLVEFARHADRRRFALHFVCLGERGPLARDLEAEDWPVTALDVPPGLWPRLVLRLAGLFRRGGADAVHTHNERPLIYAAPAARLAHVRRVVHTRHGRGVGISRRQRFLANVAARAANRYVCVSDDCAALTVMQGLPAARVATLRNGIDTRHFAFSGPRPGGPAVIVARLSPEKDITTLLHATALLLPRNRRFAWRSPATGRVWPSCAPWPQSSAWRSTWSFSAWCATWPACWRGPAFMCCRRFPRASRSRCWRRWRAACRWSPRASAAPRKSCWITQPACSCRRGIRRRWRARWRG